MLDSFLLGAIAAMMVLLHIRLSCINIKIDREEPTDD